MLLTHLGHACLLIETGGVRLLVDPGVYSVDVDDIGDLDAVLVTHQHADHADGERIVTLGENNPQARVIAEPETAALLREHLPHPPRIENLRGGDVIAMGQQRVRVQGVGDRHADNHPGVARCGNTGLLVTADGEPTLFHPGDAYDGEPDRAVDVLALPLNAPWAAMRDTLDFVARIAPSIVVPIHDGLLTEEGRTAYLLHVVRFSPEATTVQDLHDGALWDVPDHA